MITIPELILEIQQYRNESTADLDETRQAPLERDSKAAQYLVGFETGRISMCKQILTLIEASLGDVR